MTSNLQMATSVQVLRMLGANGVEANLGSKAPSTGWQPQTHSPAQSETAITSALQGNCNLGVHLAGSIVDVDIDNDDPLITAALDVFLPHSSHIWGRPSRPRTHRLYKLSEDFDPTALTKLLGYIKKEHGVEIRGGAASRGNYSLMAGSIHPSGEEYEWADIAAARSTPAVTKANVIVGSVRKAVAAGVLARYWVEGIRNDLCMALTGALHRIHALSFDDDGEKICWAMDKEEAIDYVLQVAALADDDPSDRPARVKTARQTWDKADAGLPVTGAKRFADLSGDQTIVGVIYNLLSDSPETARLEEFLARFAIRTNSGDVVDLEALATGSIRKTVMSERAFHQSYGYIRISIGAKSFTATDLLFKLPMAQRVDGLDIAPKKSQIYIDLEGNTLANSWSGFQIPPHPAPVTDAEVEPFLFHVQKILADDNADYANWIMTWLADIFQNPDDRPGTALVLVGNPGSGKSCLGSWIITKIIGKRHSVTANDLNQIVSGFNGMYADKIFTQADEALNSRQHALAAKLKALITDETMRIELKGIDSWTQRNLSRYLFTSNDRDAIHIVDGSADRRFAVFETSNKYCHDLNLWTNYREWLNNDNLAKVHRYLIDYPVNRTLISRPPLTKAKSDMIAHSMPGLIGWLSDVLVNRHPLTRATFTQPWMAVRIEPGVDSHDMRTLTEAHFSQYPNYVSIVALQDSYLEHCKRAGIKPQYTSTTSLGIALRKIFPKAMDDKIRIQAWDVDPKSGERKEIRPQLTGWPDIRTVSQYIAVFTASNDLFEDEPEEDDDPLSNMEY